MKAHEKVRPISYLKTHCAKLIRDVSREHSSIIITQKGEAKAVLQDLQSYEELQESLAMLKLLAQSRKSARAGHLTALDRALRRVTERAKRSRKV